jgi:hypothetical protein
METKFLQKVFIHKWFIILFLLFPSVSLSSLSDNMRRDEIERISGFYSDLITKYSLQSRFTLSKDSGELKLITNEKIEAQSPIFIVEPKFFFSSCDFFPFMDLFYLALEDYTNENHENFEDYIGVILAYNLLYFKMGDKAKTIDYYNRRVDLSHIKKGSYVKFTVDEEVHKYLFNLPNNILKSSLKFTEEEQEFAEKLNIDSKYRKKIREIFKYVTTHVANKTNDDIKIILNSFMSKEDEFYSLINLIHNRKFIISEESYLQLLHQSNQGEYTFIKSAMNIRKVQYCQLIAPFFDLVQYKPSSTPPQTKTFINFGLLTNSLIGAFTKDHFSEGESIHLNLSDPVDNVHLFISTGSILKDNPYDNLRLAHMLNKTLINQDQVTFCHRLGCYGIDILKAWNNKQLELIPFQYPIYKRNINLDALKILKIFQIKSPPQSIIPYLNAHAMFNYNVEMKAFSEYIKLLFLLNKKFDAKKTFEDYYKITDMINKNKISQALKYIETSYKINDINQYESDINNFRDLLHITRDKIKIISSNLNLSLEMMLRKGFQDLKKTFKK